MGRLYREGIIHFHDSDYYAQHMHNCDLVNLEDMLQNGTVITDTLIERPHSFSTACNIATQIIAQVASNQYGGQSISLAHLAPFVDVSRKKIRRLVEQEMEALGIQPTREKIEEALEVSGIWSVAGLADPQHPLLTRRPFRSPHHTASAAALTGGGPLLRPGEISLAHNGVLFLDELPEFHRDVLEAMRQPLEDGTVTVARSGGTLHLPARFQLVCAMNPCRCGWRGHPSGRCTCSDREVAKYVEKISGPLLDRIDLHVSVPAVEYASMRRKETPESSADVKCRVDAARAVQTARFAGTGVTCNAHMTAPMIGQFCCLDHAGDALMKSAFERMGLTARSHDRILRVARTIADLDGAADIRPEHLAEAIQFRNTDILKG